MLKNRTRKSIVVLLAAIAVSSMVFFSLGYYIGYRSGYDSAYLTPVRIGHLVADIHQVAFYVAYYEGYFAEEGIRPIRLEYVNGPTEMLAFAAGDLDAGYVGVVPALISKSKGTDFVIVASANLEGSAIVAKNSTNTVQDLNGKKVGTPGIGTIQDSLLSLVEEQLNINIEHKPYGGPSLLPLAFEKGEIDAYIAWEPFAAEAVVKGLGHVVYTSRDILPNHQCCVLYVSGKMLREQTDLAKKLIKIHLKATKFVTEQPNDAMAIFANRTGKTLDVVQESWNRMKWDYNVNTASMKSFVTYLIRENKILETDVPDVDEFVNNAVDAKLLSEVEASVP
jgi:NitT/TauT family transport system substrate-binding protein